MNHYRRTRRKILTPIGQVIAAFFTVVASGLVGYFFQLYT